MAAISVTGNGTLTADQVESLLITPLIQRSTYLSLGFPSFSSNGEPIKLPSLTSSFSPSFTAEGSAISELTASTSEVELLSGSVLASKALLRISNELIAQSVVNVQDQFSLKMVADTARIVDSALWAGGTATPGSPIGLANFSGVTLAGTVAGTALSSGDLIDMDTDAQLAFTDESALWWAMSPANFARVRKMTDNYGSRILQPALAAGAPGTILGHGYTVTSHLPDTGIWLFDRTQIAVGIDRTASVTLDGSRYLEYDETAVRVTFRADTKPMNAAAVIKLVIS